MSDLGGGGYDNIYIGTSKSLVDGGYRGRALYGGNWINIGESGGLHYDRGHYSGAARTVTV